MSKKKKEEELFEDWKNEILGSLSDEGKKHFEALLSLEPEGTKNHFRAGLRETTFYQRLNEVADARRQFEDEQREFARKQQELFSWYEEEAPKNERLLKERDDLARKLQGARKNLLDLGLEEEANTLATLAPTPDNSASTSALKEEVAQLKQTLRNIDVGLPGFIASGLTVASRIAKEGWNISPEEVMAFATKNRVDPKTALQELTRDEAKEREAKKMADLEKKWMDEGRKQALSQIPVPDRQRPAGPSVVDRIREGAPQTDTRTRVSGAVEEFLSMENVPGV